MWSYGGLKLQDVEHLCDFLRCFGKNDALWKIFQNSVLKGFIATASSNFEKFGLRKIGKVVRYLPAKNNIFPGSPALATARIVPKICHGQSPRTYSECFRFRPNQFILSGVISERVNAFKTRHKVNSIFGWSLASSRIITPKTVQISSQQLPKKTRFLTWTRWPEYHRACILYRTLRRYINTVLLLYALKISKSGLRNSALCYGARWQCTETSYCNDLCWLKSCQPLHTAVRETDAKTFQIGERPWRSEKVVWNSAIRVRQTIRHFLLVVWSNYVSILHLFREITTFGAQDYLRSWQLLQFRYGS